MKHGHYLTLRCVFQNGLRQHFVTTDGSKDDPNGEYELLCVFSIIKEGKQHRISNIYNTAAHVVYSLMILLHLNVHVYRQY